MNTHPQPSTLSLEQYLNLCPKLFDYRFSERASVLILERLFSEFWKANEEYKTLFFPDGPGDGPFAYKLSFAQSEVGEYTTAHKGKMCGHVFKKGESVYHCKNCGLDDTCVFCVRCFHATNHEGHNVTFSITASSGGCCDCGDPEAWKVPINCAYHTSDPSTSELHEFEKKQYESLLPQDLLDSVQSTISTVLDFMLETFYASPDSMKVPEDAESAKKEARQAAKCIKKGLHEGHEEETLFAVVLWNDEQHSFNEVIAHVEDAIKCTELDAKKIAEKVDSYGREIVTISDDLPLLLDQAKKISNINLAVTVRSARDTFREAMCGLFINWLRDLSTGKIGSHPTLLRDMICEELCREWREPNSGHSTAADDMDTGADAEPMDEDYTMQTREEIKANNIKANVEDFKKTLRLDQFLLFDLRLWKEARAGLWKLYIGTLVVNPIYKTYMGVRFARNYRDLVEAFLTKDREPEHSIILFSIQLFTVPTIATMLVNQYNFPSTIFAILHTFFTKDKIGGMESIDRKARISCESDAFKNRRYFHIFYDLKYVITPSLTQRAIPEHPQYLKLYLDLIMLFQGMNPNIRATQQHVEYENDSWIHAFNLTLQMAKSCRQMSECYNVDSRVLIHTIRQVLVKMYEWILTRGDGKNDEKKIAAWLRKAKKYGIIDKISHGEHNDDLIAKSEDFHTIRFGSHPKHLEFKVVKFDVASEPVSFHNPLHWFLAELLESIKLLDDTILAHNSLPTFKNMMLSSTEVSEITDLDVRRLQLAFDYPLRVLVLLIQIRAGIWVRNGFGIRGQCHHYREVSLRENTYDEDLFLVQTALAVLDPELVLATIVDRFELVYWVNGRQTFTLYDRTQSIFVAEEFLTLLIVLVSERGNAAGLDSEQKIRREIIHGLCLGPLAYSELTKRIPERLNEDSKFDKMLSYLATYRPPDSLTDHGTYELKDDFFDEVDPYFVHYTRNNREEAEEVLKMRLKKKLESQGKSVQPILIPKLIPITSGPYINLGDVLHTRLMNQIIYYALRHVKSDFTKSDTLVDEALQLIMMALLDENKGYANMIDRKGKSRAMDTSSTRAQEKPSFLDHAVYDRFPTTTLKRENLLEFLLDLSVDTAFKEFHAKLQFIIDNFEKLGNDQARNTIKNFREEIETQSKQKNSKETELSEYERKKRAAKERQAKIMEQFAKAQQSFIEKHEDLYGEDEDMDEDWEITGDEEHADNDEVHKLETLWHYPSGTCIVCQEETTASQMYGMLGLIQPSSMMRQTPFDDKDYVMEIIELPESLDRKYDRTVPYGVASKLCDSHDTPGISEENLDKPLLSKGFPSNSCRPGLYASTCGHLMHVKCFETYFASLEQRHQSQLARNHPEDVKRKEFMCPLCKSLGNALLPIVWKTKKEMFPGVLEPKTDFNTWLNEEVLSNLEKLEKSIQLQLPASTSAAVAGITNDYGALLETTSSLPPQPRRRSSINTSRFREAINQLVHEFWRQPASSISSNEPNSSPASVVDASTMTEDEDKDTRKMYERLVEVLRITSEQLTPLEGPNARVYLLKSVDMLWELLGGTITCVEIAQRGVASISADGLPSLTLVDSISTQMLTLLRVLSETIPKYTNIMVNVPLGEAKLKKFVAQKFREIFADHPAFPTEDNKAGSPNAFLAKLKVGPFLLEDPFLVLAEISMYPASLVQFEFHHLMRLLYIAEIVRIVIAIGESSMDPKTRGWVDNPCVSIGNPNYEQAQERQREFASIRKFAAWALHTTGMSERDVMHFLNDVPEPLLYKMVKTFSLPFLRKCAILMNAKFGVVYPKPGLESLEMDEVDEHTRLYKLFRLPSLDEIFAIPESRSGDDAVLAIIMNGWCSRLYSWRQDSSRVSVRSTNRAANTVSPNVSSSSSQAQFHAHPILSTNQTSPLRVAETKIRLNHPAIFELVGLPKRLDALFEISIRKVCEKCNSVPNDPALCLLCGDFVCFQSYCCSGKDGGECNIHARCCAGNIGMYLLVKKCVLLLLHGDNGCFMNAPYLDTHGEVDLGLK
ncbi:181_t:CDS:2 [Paraglomus brasilianum]|uniref:E3 ubiquitin-protein ligase n=1 Tax=Paraglomus brasilianum TaxID=144538 RepID=A0A9N9BQX0_9GLOM|nr:181_t:CDS:2 [Paraglomus brasilianum]